MRFKKLFKQFASAFVIQLAWSSLLVPELLSQEQSFPSPPVTGILGAKDTAANAEIAAFLQATSVTGWHDLEASGSLTLPPGHEYSATLWLSGSQEARLDIVMNSGTRSLRVNSTSATFLDERGNKGLLLPETASAGIVAFPRLWSIALSSPTISLRDGGTFAGTGKALHRITMEYPYASAKGVFLTTSTDLYFDPATNLLAISVENLRFIEAQNRLFRRVTLYENYKTLGGVQIPTSIQQTIDGQLQWTLQLTQATVNSNPPDETYSF